VSITLAGYSVWVVNRRRRRVMGEREYPQAIAIRVRQASETTLNDIHDRAYQKRQAAGPSSVEQDRPVRAGASA
jgi:hypothetical protein